MSSIRPDKHTVSGHVDLYTAIYLEEFSAVSGWSRSKIIGSIIEDWLSPGGFVEIDVEKPELHAETQQNLRTGSMKCLDRLFGRGQFVPVADEELEKAEPADYKEKVRLFASRARARRLNEFYPHVEFGRERFVEMVAESPPESTPPSKSPAGKPRPTPASVQPAAKRHILRG